MRLCVDTSAYSHFKRGDQAAVEAFAGARELGLPAIVLGELRAGFGVGRRRQRNEDELRELLTHPLVRVLEVDAHAAEHYAEIYVQLRRAGTPVPTNDLWIAALAAREGMPVLTYDARFERIARIGTRVLRTR